MANFFATSCRVNSRCSWCRLTLPSSGCSFGTTLKSNVRRHKLPRPSLTCYACDAAKTSREHAPPKCLFPEKDELPLGVDLRKNLIRVPSCDAHNSEKSTDDEFLMWVFSVQSQGNHYRELTFHTKAIRAFRERPLSLLALLEKPVQVSLLAADGRLLPSAAIEIDFSRFERCMVQIAKALYFKETGAKWRSSCTVFTNLFHGMRGTGAAGLNDIHHQAISVAQSAMAQLPSKGQNPEIFVYRFAELRTNLKVLLMSYYGHIQVLVKYGDA